MSKNTAKPAQGLNIEVNKAQSLSQQKIQEGLAAYAQLEAELEGMLPPLTEQEQEAYLKQAVIRVLGN